MNQQLHYCNFSISSIKKILSNAFNIADTEEIEEAYKIFKEDFYLNREPGKQQFLARKSFLPKTTDQLFLEKHLSDDYKIGVDLPVLISSKNNNKVVIIIGEDPLRNSPGDGIVLSTPFGTHSIKYKTNHGKLYWEFSLYLLEKGYNVYYTDLKKLWIQKGQQKKLSIPNDLLENFKSTLNAEIQQFTSPEIVTFGSDAERTIKEFNLEQEPISFIHPSVKARKHWKSKYQLENVSNATVLQKMKDIFNKRTCHSSTTVLP